MKYERQRASARRAIEKAGVECGWQLPAPADPNAKPWRDDDADEDAAPDRIPVPIAWFSPSDVGKGNDVFAAFIPNTEVQYGSEVGLMPGDVTFEPEAGHTVYRGDEELRVTKVDRLAPAGDAILFYVWVS